MILLIISIYLISIFLCWLLLRYLSPRHLNERTYDECKISIWWFIPMLNTMACVWYLFEVFDSKMLDLEIFLEKKRSKLPKNKFFNND